MAVCNRLCTKSNLKLLIMNTFGNIYKLTCFGESHGPAIGGVIDGCPAGVEVDMQFIQSELDRRRPGGTALGTARDEADKVEFLSGIFEGRTTGTPIGFAIFNTDQRSRDYSSIKDVFRPSHADYTYFAKYGTRDYRGGGRSSARETAARVVAGALAKLALKAAGYPLHINARITEVGGVRGTEEEMNGVILDAKRDGDSVGGIITCTICGVPAGWGEPVAGKLHAMLAAAMMSINAAKGFEYGSGFEGCRHRGSEQNDAFAFRDGKVVTLTNNSGGIQGGISNGMDIYFNVAFKPIATIFKQQQSVDTSMNPCVVEPKGRHDSCVLPRALPIVESMAAMVMLDACLMSRSSRIGGY